MENHMYFSVLPSGKEVMVIDGEMTSVTKQMTVEKSQILQLLKDFAAKLKWERFLIAGVIEHPNQFPSLVRAETRLCKRNLCQGQAGAERENKTYKENKWQFY